MTGTGTLEAQRPVRERSWSDRQRGRALTVGLFTMKLGPLLMLAILAAVMTALSPVFLTERNLQNLALQTSPIAIVTIGQLMVILTRGVDLSVGSSVSLATVIGAMVADSSDSALLVILTMLGVGAGVGALNALLIVKLRLANPIIVTLGMLSVVGGAALILAHGIPNSGMPHAIVKIGSGYVGPVPAPALIVLAFTVAVWFFASRVRWGRWIYAIGGNPEAALRVGISVDRVLASVYVFSGLTAGVAAVLITGRTDSGYPLAGSGLELLAVTAVIIGGASFFGGRGSVPSMVVGALILGGIGNGLNLLSIDSNYQVVVTGWVLVVAVGFDVIRTRLETLFRSEQGRLQS